MIWRGRSANNKYLIILKVALEETHFFRKNPAFQNYFGVLFLESHFHYFFLISHTNSFLYARLQTGRIMVWWYPSGSPSVRPVSVRPFSALFSYMLWHIEMTFCTWLCFNVLQIKFECHYFASIFEGVMPLCELRIWEIHSFPHFSPTCFDILSWNFAHDFFLMYYRASSSVISLRQFLKELCLFWNLEYRKYSFPQFSPACSDILSWNFAHDFVLIYFRASSSVVTLRQFLKELCFFVDLVYRKYSFPHFFSYMLWHIELKFCTWLCFNVLQIKFECHHFASIFEGVMPLLELRI